MAFLRFLLIDDSNTMRRIVAAQLQTLGISDIIEAHDGEEGLAKLEESMPVDYIMLDINMPKMDGMTCLKKIRENPKYNNVKIFMVTSEAEKQKVLEAVRAGANDYIVKPFTAETFKERLGQEVK